MSSKNITILVATLWIFSLLVVTGCESDAQTGALIGTAAGAGIGQLAGGHTESTLIGAAVGGGIGYILGNEQDKQKAEAEMKRAVKMAPENEDIQQHLLILQRAIRGDLKKIDLQEIR